MSHNVHTFCLLQLLEEVDWSSEEDLINVADSIFSISEEICEWEIHWVDMVEETCWLHWIEEETTESTGWSIEGRLPITCDLKSADKINSYRPLQTYLKKQLMK